MSTELSKLITVEIMVQPRIRESSQAKDLGGLPMIIVAVMNCHHFRTEMRAVDQTLGNFSLCVAEKKTRLSTGSS